MGPPLLRCPSRLQFKACLVTFLSFCGEFYVFDVHVICPEGHGLLNGPIPEILYFLWPPIANVKDFAKIFGLCFFLIYIKKHIEETNIDCVDSTFLAGTQCTLLQTGRTIGKARFCAFLFLTSTSSSVMIVALTILPRMVKFYNFHSFRFSLQWVYEKTSSLTDAFYVVH